MLTSFMHTTYFNPSRINPPHFSDKGNILALETILTNGMHNWRLFYNFATLIGYRDYTLHIQRRK